MALKGLSDRGRGSSYALCAGINYARKMGAELTSNSYGGSNSYWAHSYRGLWQRGNSCYWKNDGRCDDHNGVCVTGTDCVDCGNCASYDPDGDLFVVAAGNDASGSKHYPCAVGEANVLCVASIDEGGSLSG